MQITITLVTMVGVLQVYTTDKLFTTSMSQSQSKNEAEHDNVIIWKPFLYCEPQKGPVVRCFIFITS